MRCGRILGWLENLSNNGLQNLFFCKVFFIKVQLEHGIIIRTGITCKKIPVICATQLAGGLLLKNLKYFKVMLNIFEFSRV